MAATLSAEAPNLTAVLGGNPDWFQRASCMGVDPDLFFPERGASTREAKEVCRGCPVCEDCLEYAIVVAEKHGVWGGKSERERRVIRRARAAGQ
jgi:WhiB family transcriptional regulator, redox-sensing transcriptional regulator